MSQTSFFGNAALRQPGFAAFLSARLLGMFSQQMQAVVVAWQVYDITRDPLSLAYVGLAQFLPMLLLLIPAGDIADRMSRKRLLGMSWSVAAVCATLLLWLTTLGEHGVGGIYAVLVLFGCSRAFTGPAMQSLLPQIVPRDQLAQALATNSIIMRTGAIAAPRTPLQGTMWGACAGRGSFYPQPPHRVGNHFAGPVCCVAGRGGCTAAGVCQGSAADRP